MERIAGQIGNTSYVKRKRVNPHHPKSVGKKSAKKSAFSSGKRGFGGMAIPRTRGNLRDSTWVLLEKVNNNAKSTGKRGLVEGRSSRDFDGSEKRRMNRFWQEDGLGATAGLPSSANRYQTLHCWASQ
jgi:hypothetical protein